MGRAGVQAAAPLWAEMLCCDEERTIDWRSRSLISPSRSALLGRVASADGQDTRAAIPAAPAHMPAQRRETLQGASAVCGLVAGPAVRPVLDV